MKLSTTILSATLLAGALALAGCGGSSNGAMDDDMDSGPTLEEQLAAEKAAKEKAEAELEAERKRQAEEQAAADAEAAQKSAMNLRTVLMAAIADLADSNTTESTTKPADFASKDGSARETVSVMGDPFNNEYSSDLTLAAALAANSGEDQNDRVAGSSFSTSGLKTHKSNGLSGGGAAQFTTPGSYHGVSGTYTCAPDSANSCTSNVNGDGNLVLAGGDWTFKPANGNQMVSDSTSIEWGWWVDKDASDKITKAGVFYGHTASPDALSGITNIGGKASYSGKAVGKYAIHRGAGAVNDAGHFEADASLTANFTDSEISGMVDNFTGADGEPRDWSVKLVSQTIGADGVFSDTTGDDVPDGTGMTVWTMGGADGAASGEWVGQLYDQSASGVTPSTAAGAFTANHGNIGNMIGAFGAEKD